MVTISFKLKQFQETLFPICQDKIETELKVKEDKLTLKEIVELMSWREVLSTRQVQTMKIINHKSQI